MLERFRALQIWEQWLWVSAVGGTLVDLLLRLIGISSGNAVPAAMVAVFVGQWFLLRGRMRGAGWWPLTSAIFGFIGTAVGGVYGGRFQDAIDGVPSSPEGIADLGPGRTVLGLCVGLAVGGLLAGAFLGLGQRFILRRTLKKAGWWIVAMAGGSMIGSLLELPVLAAGIASSLALMWLWQTNEGGTPIRSTTEPGTTPGWGFYLQWVCLTVLGFAVGEIANNDMLGFSPPADEQSLRNVLAWFGGGACVGAAQWYLLRRHIAASWRWVVATAIGWALGIKLFVYGSAILNGLLAALLSYLPAIKDVKDFPFALLDYPFGGAVVGMFIGVLQWMLLRRESLRSGWWIPASVAGWAVTYVATNNMGPVRLGTAMAFGAITGPLTGIVLIRLLKKTGTAIPEESHAYKV